MIWSVLGTLGALSFLQTGLNVLTNPNCVSADIGGGSRVLRVTCRDDEFGGMSGTSAGFLVILIGAGLLVILYWRYIKRYVSGTPSKQIAFTEIISVPDTQSLKVDEINTETETDNSKIKFCKCNQTIKESWGTEERESINYCLFCDLISDTKIYVSGTPSKQIAFTEIISVPDTQSLKVDEINTETETDNSKIKFCKCNQTIKESWGTEERESINYCLFCDLISDTKITVSQEMDSDNEVKEYKNSQNKSIRRKKQSVFEISIEDLPFLIQSAEVIGTAEAPLMMPGLKPNGPGKLFGLPNGDLYWLGDSGYFLIIGGNNVSSWGKSKFDIKSKDFYFYLTTATEFSIEKQESIKWKKWFEKHYPNECNLKN